MAQNWLETQWIQIRGHAKWELLKLAGILVIPAAYLLLQRLRNLQLDWLVAAGIFIVSAGVLLYLGKIRINVPQSSSTQTTAATLSAGKAFDAAEFFRLSYYSPLQAEIETNTRTAAQQNQPNDREGFYVKLIAIGLLSFTYDTIWLTIYKSQLMALLEVNRQNGLLPMAEFKAYYNQAAAASPAAYANYSFEKWSGYMTSQILVIIHPSQMVEITARGKDFLKYAVHWGKDANQKNL